MRILIALLLTTALAGCSLTPKNFPIPGQKKVEAKTSPDQIWAMHKLRLLDIRNWNMKGKMGVKTAFKGGSATVIWDRALSTHNVEIFGPFGGGRIRIAEDPFGATLTDNKKNVTIGETAYKLLYKEVGWPVPFDAMKYWVIGLPIPDVWAKWELNDQGYLGWLSQAGWEVTFEDYRDRGGVPMPRKIQLKALDGTVNLKFPDGKVSNTLNVKLVVQRLKLESKQSAGTSNQPSG